MVREFQELRRFLEEQERLLLVQLGDLDRAIGQAQDEALAKVSEELSQLDTLIWEMEGKFQQPPSHFLQVRVQSAWTGRGKGGKSKIQDPGDQIIPMGDPLVSLSQPWECPRWDRAWTPLGSGLGVD